MGKAYKGWYCQQFICRERGGESYCCYTCYLRKQKQCPNPAGPCVNSPIRCGLCQETDPRPKKKKSPQRTRGSPWRAGSARK